MELELNSLDWNGNELEHELELEDMKRTRVWCVEKKSWKQGLRIARPRLEGISWITNRKSWCVLRFPTAIAKIWRQVHRSFTSPLRILKIIRNDSLHGLRTPIEAFFHQNSKLLGLGRQFISTHFGTVRPFSMFSINQPVFLQKTKPFISTSQLFIWDWDLNLNLNLSRKELGI